MATRLKYYGISFFEVEAQGRKILIDPCVTANRLCPIRVEDIGQADIILVTHGAKDHMGDAIEIQKKTGATIVCDPAVKIHAIRNGVSETKVISVLWGDQIRIGEVHVQAVECRHISFLASGDTYLSGLPLSFILCPEEGTRIYNVGDSALFSDMKLIGELYQPNIALVPVGGSPELTGGWAHLPPREASLCVQWVRPEVTIPTHFDPDSAEGDLFADRVGELAPATRVVLLKPGESFLFQARE
ncbi:MAG TPA: metal-dependent hydrolase [Dehalococcoidia bacterium]|nr:metal-dependent hydrolase [Dehalococcoidia bacterium]